MATQKNILEVLPREVLEEILLYIPFEAVYTFGKASRAIHGYIAKRLEPLVNKRFKTLPAWTVQDLQLSWWLQGAIEGLRADIGADGGALKSFKRSKHFSSQFRTVWKGMLNEQVKTVLQLEIPLDPSKPLVKEKINFLWWSAQFPKSSTWKTIYSTYLYMDMSPELAKALSLTANTVQVKLFHITRYNATCAGGIIAKMTTLFNSISFAGRHNWTTVDVWDGLLDLCNSSTLKKSITLSWLKPAEWSSDDETGQLPSREIEEHLPALAVTHPAYGLLRDAAPYVGAKCMRDLMHGSQSWCTSVQTTIPAIISRCERAGYLSQKQRDVLQRVGKYQWEQGTFQKTPYFDDWLLRFTVREDQMQGEFRLQDRMTFRLECLDDGSESDFPGQDIPRVLIAFTCQYDESQKSEPLDMLDAATLRGVCTELGLMHYWNPDGPVISRNDGLLFALLACAFPADAPIEWAWSLCRKMLDKQRAWMTA